ncbi:rod shape-determining protein RodA [Virgibacillus sp. NKC19-3]|uniref:rod shape-determining protein RodA n=1 Tax=Virgibacillus saliphilus TaxID=2831674 RepID=UPI001C9ADE1C|nr:rod shape-determining protein RodA [Virgibacillus sp. NKC19-3]MBY7144058.1 rod shape-determining protein RodA [Virgibacillus sp. NKC19-3]
MQSNLHKADQLLLILIFSLFIYSLLAVYSGSGQYVQEEPFYFLIRQIVWYLIGAGLMFLVAKFDYELLEKWAVYLYIGGVILLLAVHFFGTEKNGSQRWLSFGFFEIQPSEFMKIFLILYISFILSKVGKSSLTFKNSIPVVCKVALYSLIPFILIFAQPDLGSALVILGIAVALILVSNISTKALLALFSVATTLLGLFAYFFYFHHDLFTKVFKPHQLSRIYGWLDPVQYGSDYGYQLQQAITGIGSGQLTGKGFNEGVQVQSGKVPEAHTDFIFAVIGEEFGFIGTSLLVLIYLLLIYRIIHISLQANNLFGAYICVGTIGLISLQVFQNIGMTIGVMPITGLALPLVSYGGSALLTNFIALGLVLSVQMRSKQFMFSKDDIIS